MEGIWLAAFGKTCHLLPALKEGAGVWWLQPCGRQGGREAGRARLGGITLSLAQLGSLGTFGPVSCVWVY
jgi:hypothetical protein